MTRRREGVCLALFWALLIAVFAGTISTDWKTPDVASAEAAAWRIAHTGEPWVDGVASDEYILSVDIAGDTDYVPRSKLVLFTTRHRNGHAVVTRTPGVIAVGVPAFFVQALVDPRAAETLSPVPGAITGAVLAATAVLLLLLASRDLVPFRILLATGLAVAFTTPYWSVAADALWTHSVTTLAIAGMAWGARRERWWLVGLFGGIGLWGRMHVVVIVAILGVSMALWRRRPAIALVVAATSVPFLGAAFAWGHWMYGTWSLQAATGGYGNVDRLAGGNSEIDATNLLGYLISPGAGLLVWTPVLLVLLPATVRQWRSVPDWARALAGAGIAYLLVQAMLNRFHGGTGFWGNRLGLETLTCLVPLLVCALVGLGARERVVVVVALAYQAGLILPGAVFNISHNHGFAWRENDFYLAVQDNPGVMAAGCLLGVALTLVTTWIVCDAGRRGQLRAEPAT